MYDTIGPQDQIAVIAIPPPVEVLRVLVLSREEVVMKTVMTNKWNDEVGYGLSIAESCDPQPVFMLWLFKSHLLEHMQRARVSEM